MEEHLLHMLFFSFAFRQKGLLYKRFACSIPYVTFETPSFHGLDGQIFTTTFFIQVFFMHHAFTTKPATETS